MSDPRPSRNFVPNITLERYLLRELPAGESRRLEDRLAADSALRERLQSLETSNRRVLKELPPEGFARAVRERLRRRDAEESLRRRTAGMASPPFSGNWRPLLGSLAVLVLLALPAGLWLLGERTAGVVSETSETGAGTAAEETRIKGLEPRLAVFRRTEEGAEALLPGEKARPGDVLRLGYQSGGFSHGAIFSVDGNGNVTRHWPARGGRASSLRGGEVLLPSAFELDTAPGYERFYFIVSDRSFALDPVLEVLHAHRDIPRERQPEHTRIVRFDVLKDHGI